MVPHGLRNGDVNVALHMTCFSYVHIALLFIFFSSVHIADVALHNLLSILTFLAILILDIDHIRSLF